MAYNVKFLKGTAAQYAGVTSKDKNTFYYVDEADLYLGALKLSNAADLAAAITRISTNETDIDNLQKDIQALTGGETGSISGMISDAVDAAKVDLRKEISANTTAIEAEATRAKGIEGGLETRLAAVEADYLVEADKTELSNAIAAEKTRAEGIEAGLRTDVNAIKGDYLKTADKTELEGKITTNADAIAAVKEDVDTFFADADLTASAKDTLKEIQEYINSDATAAAEMTASIQQNAKDIDALEAKVGTTTVEAQIEAAIAAENLSQYATDTELSALQGVVDTKADDTDLEALTTRVTTVEGKVDVEKVSTAIANAKSEAATDAKNKADAALEDAKDYADSLAGNYATAAQGTKADSALQAADIKTGSANGTIAVKGTDVAVKGLGSAAYTEASAYDASGAAAQALADAKTYADTAEADALAAAKTYANGLAGNYDAAGSASAALADAKEYTDNALTWGTIA